MKKIFSFVIASLLLLSAALPVAKAQTLISSLLPSSGCPKYPVQEIRALSIDVCKSPKIKQNGSVTSPNLSLSREAMIFGSINVTIGSYMNNFNGLSGVKGTWKLRVNMGDGTPWMTVPTAGTTLTANYPLGTNPKILYNAIVDRDTFNMNDDSVSTSIDTLYLFIKNPMKPYNPPDKIWKINAGKFVPPLEAVASYAAGDPVLATTDAEGFAYIKLAAGHSKLTKPIIFVDGVDFDSEDTRYTDKDITLNSNYESNIVRCGVTGWDIFIRGAEDAWDEPGTQEAYREFPKMFNDLSSKGFDVIFLDFAQGATYIQKNATVLKALINRVNAEKDSTAKEENIIVGASMGGQVARMTLAQMERDKQNHCTRMYVSFDSPQKGANIPLSLQALSWLAFHTGFLPGNWTKLNTPAAKQMLEETLADDVAIGKVKATITDQNGTAISGINFKQNYLRPAFKAEMAALGYPQKAQNIAIVDGDEQGRNITGDSNAPFPDNASMLSVTASTAGTALVRGQLFALNGSLGVSNIPNNTIFEGKAPFTLDISFTPLKIILAVFTLNQTLPTFDNAPGCMRGDLRGLRRQINDAQKGLDKLSGVPLSLTFPPSGFQPNFCFMPTMSTLDIRNPSNPNQWNWTANPSILQQNIKDEKIHINQLTPFFDHYAPPSGNLRHVEIDEPMRIWIRTFLEDTDKDDLTKYKILPYNDKKTYNYNYRQNHITSVTVNPTGILKVNDDGESAFNNPLFYERPVFEAHLGDYCGGATVTVNGGQFIVGSPTNKERSAEITVTRDNVIDLKSGELSMHNNSKIIIKDGAKLYVRSGTLKLLGNSQIVIEQGGYLSIDPAVNIVLNNSAIAGNSEARILIENEGTLQLTGLNTAGYNFGFSGNGHFAFETGHILKLEDNNKVPNPVDFKWKGSGKDKRLIRLINTAWLKIPERNVEIINAAIEYDRRSVIFMKKGISLRLNNVTAYQDKSFGKDGIGFRIQEGKGQINVYNSTFDGLEKGIEVYAEPTTAPKSSGYSTTNNYIIHVTAQSSFVNCGTGCSILNNQGAVYFTNNVSCIDNVVGVFVDFNSRTVQFNGCVLQHNIIGSMVKNMPRGGSLIHANSTIEKNVYGSVLYLIKNAVFSNCRILNHNDQNNSAAITNELLAALLVTIGNCDINLMCGVLDLYNSNIIVTEGTYFVNNNFGIYKNVDDSDPINKQDAVILDCSTFNNNKYGIKGMDIALQNDGAFSQPSLGYPTRPNNFIQNKEGIRLFDICYTYTKGKIMPTLINMRYNFWSTNKNGAGTIPDPETINLSSNCISTSGETPTGDCEHCSKSKSCIKYVTSPELKQLIKECPFIRYPEPDPEGTLFAKVGSGSQCYIAVSEGAAGAISVHAQYRNAYAYLISEKEEDVDKAMDLLKPIALLPIGGTEESEACDHYIRMARAFTDIYPDKEILNLGRVQKARATIYPNPTDDIINVHLEKGEYNISILDVQGRLIHQEEATSDIVVDTNKWLSGVYQVFITNKNTGAETTEKVVVTRY